MKMGEALKLIPEIVSLSEDLFVIAEGGFVSAFFLETWKYGSNFTHHYNVHTSLAGAWHIQ